MFRLQLVHKPCYLIHKILNVGSYVGEEVKTPNDLSLWHRLELIQCLSWSVGFHAWERRKDCCCACQILGRVEWYICFDGWNLSLFLVGSWTKAGHPKILKWERLGLWLEKSSSGVERGVDLLGSRLCKHAAVAIAFAQRDGGSPLLVVMHRAMSSKDWFLCSTIPFCCGLRAWVCSR